ncbi:hypothetical protein N7492_006849 [Penicillium capsulatum]|uniref:Uncharacterized protein n=1 Tax=Penicillium capsulatum TaxID=69766 RepID=A0A9W9I1I4_9EURO|nr:hypothetical protein N7492_006849 [Penicillium capsulatum]
MASLEHLSLFARDYFGFYPHLDLSNLYFPRLMTLSLGNFCFFHDRQIDWILKHGDTLEEIYLDDCTILYDFCMMDYNVEHCGLPRSALARRIGDDVSVYGSYGKRWHDIFDLFAEKLPKLRYFRIGSGYWFDGVPFEQEDEIKPGLYYNRYMACYDGFGPSPYMERAPGEDGIEKGWWQKRPECDEEDRAALRRLLGKIGQSIEEIP